MKKVTERILQEAGPYLDVRDNDVHVRISLEFAERLLQYHPEADEDIVLPAIILHDIGWKSIPEEELLESFGPRMKDNTNRRRHETEGAKIAKQILLSLGFQRSKINRITNIIDGHDTRVEAISLNDQLVKDADKLWRFTSTGFNIDHQRFETEIDEHLASLAKAADHWFFTPEAKQMARQALDRLIGTIKSKPSRSLKSQTSHSNR